MIERDGYRYRTVEETPDYVAVEVYIDGCDEPYATEDARRQAKRALVRANQGEPGTQPVSKEQLDTQLGELDAWYDARPDTRPRKWHRYLTGLPRRPGRKRETAIRDQLDHFVLMTRAHLAQQQEEGE